MPALSSGFLRSIGNEHEAANDVHSCAAAAIASGAVHTVENETNYHTFSSRHPVLARIRPGDVVVTKTVDSAGFDYKGVRHTKTHGNPLTGPFYVEGAEPGDAIVVHLNRVRLNRTTGYTAFRVARSIPEARDKYAPKPYAEGAVLPGRTDLDPFRNRSEERHCATEGTA